MIRKLVQSSLSGLLLFLAGAGMLHAQNEVTSELPPFMLGPLQDSGLAQVVEVSPTAVADIVVISGGYAEGFDVGMICNVGRGNASVARLILVEVTENAAAGLILELADAAPIQAGDRVLRSTLAPR